MAIDIGIVLAHHKEALNRIAHRFDLTELAYDLRDYSSLNFVIASNHLGNETDLKVITKDANRICFDIDSMSDLANANHRVIEVERAYASLDNEYILVYGCEEEQYFSYVFSLSNMITL
jgi:hypothetical protein